MAKYDNAFGPRNSYGRALELILRHVGHAAEGDDRIHLDIGCGHGHLAEELRKQTGLTYVGLDIDEEAVAALGGRGFEAHVMTLAGFETTAEGLEGVVAGRRVASISVLDVLEHLPDADGPMQAVGALAAKHGALTVLSVPNVTHRDVGLKLAFGRWDVTETGILDATHVRFYTRRSLEQDLRSFGLYKFDEANVELARSDQHFPATHPALGERTSLHQYLTSLRRDAATDQQVNQFVWVCSPGPRATVGAITYEREPARPFLSAIVRTQGSRMNCLTEVLTCLAAQTCQDFEVVIVGHKVDVAQQIDIERVIEETPTRLRSRIRLVLLDHGSRSAPLNLGFAAADGRYIAILDDDDLVFANWVETFEAAERRAAGRMIRTISAPQDAEMVSVLGRQAATASGVLVPTYPATFDFLEHLAGNYTPNTAVAFPRGVFHDLGQRFDEELSTTEDWDFMMRVASIVGVESVPVVTCIYRWWTESESSRTMHDQHEWARNNGAILKKFDESQILFPAGSARRVREILQEVQQLRRNLQEVQVASGSTPPHVDDRSDLRADLLLEINSILESRSWRLAAPLRALSRAAGRGRRVALSNFADHSVDGLDSAITALRQSRSWRATRPLRRG